MRFLRSLVISIVLLTLLTGIVMAQTWEYRFPTIVTDTSATDRTGVPAMLGYGGQSLIDSGKINANGLDTNMQIGTNSIDYMMSTTQANIAIPSLPASAKVTASLYTGYSPVQTTFSVITGDGGYGTITDSASMEQGNLFQIEHEDAWINTIYASMKYLNRKQGVYDVRVTAAQEVTAGIHSVEVVDVTPTALAAWTDVDVSGYIASDATGVVLEIDGAGAAAGVRKNGSTDNRILNMEHNWAMIGVDANGVFEAYVSANTVINLVGYTDANWTFKTNADDVSAAGVGWLDVDVSAEAPNSVGVIVEVNNTGGGGTNVGIRNNGSVDVRFGGINATSHYFAVIGVDSSQIFEGNVSNLAIDFYVIGYTTANAVFNVDGVDKSIAGAAWIDIDASVEAPNAEALIFEVWDAGGGGNTYGFRQDGSTDATIQNLNNTHGWAVVPCNELQVVEGYVTNVNTDFFLVGYIVEGSYIYYEETSATEERGQKVVATSIASGEYDFTTSIKDDPGVASYDASVDIGVSMGSGILPVRILEKQTLTSAAATVTFTGIDTLVADWDAKANVTSRHLVVMVNAKSPDAVGNRALFTTFNGDGGNNYNYQILQGVNVAAGASRASNQTSIVTGWIPGTTYVNGMGGGTTLIPHAFNSINHKSTISLAGASEEVVGTIAGRWADTSAITSITLTPSAGNFDTDSTFILGVVDERYLVEEDLLVGDGLPVFDTIPQDGHDLVAIGYCRSDRADDEDSIYHELNNDAVAANYNRQRLQGFGAGTFASQANENLMAIATATTALGNEYAPFIAFYSQYAEGTNDVAYLALSGYHESTDPTSSIQVWSGRWNNVSAITKLEYFPNLGANFKSGSLFSLYRVPRYLIDRQELTVAAPTITFSNIPQGYEALQLNVYARSDKAAALLENMEITINADAVAANYDSQGLTGTAGVVAAVRVVASQVIMIIPAVNEGANEFGSGVLTFNQYSTTVGHKHFTVLSGRQENQVTLLSSRWEDTSAINSIQLDLAGANNFIAGSVFELVGVMPTKSFMIEVDSEVEAIEAAGNSSVPNNTANMEFGQLNSISYAEAHKFNKDNVLRFDGTATSNVNAGAINSDIPDYWVSVRFKLDNDFSAASATDQFIWGKWVGAAEYVYVYLESTDGKLYYSFNDGGANPFVLTSTTVAWTADTWYQALCSLSDAGGGTQRMLIDNVLEDSDVVAASNTPNGGDFIFGDFDDPGSGTGTVGVVANVVVGIDELSAAEETALFSGTLPGDETDYWPANEGNGTAIVSYGSLATAATADTRTYWNIEARGQELGQYEAWYEPNTMVVGTAYNGTADAGGTTTTIVDAELTQANDYWNYALVTITDTTDDLAPIGETSVIYDFIAATDTLYLYTALTAAPDAGDTYTVDFGTLQDRTAKDNDARITWGVNQNLTILYEEMVSSEDTTAVQSAALGFDMPTSAIPSTWFASGGNVASLPLYPSILAVSTSTGIAVQTLYFIILIGIALMCFLLLAMFTKSAFVGVMAMVIVLFVGSSMTIIPMWIPFAVVIVDLGIMFLYRQVSY